MSVSVVLKNIYTFANVLSQAATDIVTSWDDRSLQNAFNWACYCQQIEKQVRGKPTRHELDEQIRCLTLYLCPASLIELTLDTLATADVKLAAVLLGNPFLPVHIRSKVEGYVGNQTNTNYNQILTIGDNIDFSGNKKISTFIYGLDRPLKQSPEALAVVFMGKLARLKHLATTDNRFINFLENVLDKIAGHQSGWEVLLQSLLTEIEHDDNHDVIETVKEFVMNWLLNTCDIESEFWCSRVQLLTECTSRSDVFLNMYLNHLISWGNTMERQYRTIQSGDLYTWCYQGKPSKASLSYGSLLDQWVAVLSHNARNRVKVERRLMELGQQSHFNIWKDIMLVVQSH